MRILLKIVVLWQAAPQNLRTQRSPRTPILCTAVIPQVISFGAGNINIDDNDDDKDLSKTLPARPGPGLLRRQCPSACGPRPNARKKSCRYPPRVLITIHAGPRQSHRDWYTEPAYFTVNSLLSYISHHGYLLLALACFAEAIGLPVPAALAILTAGAVAAYGGLHFYLVFGIGVLTMIAGDLLLYYMGKASGWALLGFLCRLSANPETCILRSAEYFYRRGKLTLLFAKFIPGINTMSPPLAGSMKMRLRDFLLYDAMGVALYIGVYAAAGDLFSDALRAITRGLRSAGFAAEVIFGIGLLAYIAYRIWIYHKYRLLDVIPRIPAEELAKRLASDAARNLLIADVRSHGYYDADSERIAGSIRIEPNNLIEEIKNLPKEQEIYLYCT
jgi:membrane protein DedA with SNARE-associated domain